jgi:hypothetical protein
MGDGGYFQLVSTLGVFEVGVWDKRFGQVRRIRQIDAVTSTNTVGSAKQTQLSSPNHDHESEPDAF